MFSLTNKIKSVLDFLTIRNNLTASNIANADTPKYKAIDINFEDQLKEAFRTGDDISLTISDPRHIKTGSIEIDKFNSNMIFESTGDARIDGNNVDIDKEMVKLAENQITYSSLVQIVTKEINGLRYSIEEGKRG